MNSNTKSLIQACKNLGLNFSCHHRSENLYSVIKNANTHFFCNWKTPLNSESIARICRDKDYCFHITKDWIKNPQTIAHISPYIDPEKKLDATALIKEMSEVSSSKLSFPLIIKSNALSLGTNVFLCQNLLEAEQAITKVFNTNSKDYDYIALAQEYISIKKEYRAVFLNGSLEFAYTKESPPVSKGENLSPLHRQGAKASLIICTEELRAIKDFCKLLFENIKIPFCGLDIAKDEANNYYLIEINSSPSFDFFERDNGDKKIVSLYEKILTLL